MFKSLFGVVTDVVKIAVAPIEIAADATRAVTKPIADVVEETVKDIKDELTDDNSPK